jgi:hypothetical protein
MGRPIKKKFFQFKGIVPTDVVGQAVAGIVPATTGSNYSTSTTLTVAPPVDGGVQATATANIVNGTIASVNVVTGGGGYTTPPLVTVQNYGTGTGASFVVTLTTPSATSGSLTTTAFVPSGTSAIASEIIKQESSHKYLVENQQGTGVCKLTASDSLTAGQMNILATDTLGSQYWVMKLTAHKVLLKQRSNGGSGYQFADGSYAQWNTTSATGNYVSLAVV